jgi:prephenate dehydrogenase
VPPTPTRAAIVGTGLIGGSIGLALRASGWYVTGRDRDADRADRALELGALDAVGDDPDAAITFVATPVGAAPAEVERALAVTGGWVTDVGSVKAPIVAAQSDPRFVGGHPMAGSEQLGIDGATGDLFEGAVWVLTPHGGTDDRAYVEVRSVVAALGAEVVALPAADHDALVALVSHVPHLTAATLMAMADTRSNEHRALLRLAAGGFRDMTRIAAGDPGIWPDICTENATAITAALDGLIEELSRVRSLVAEHDRAGLLGLLGDAQRARRALPAALEAPGTLVEVRVPVPDRPGVLAEVTTLAPQEGINIEDIEIAHSGEGEGGVLILVVAAEAAEAMKAGLARRGYRSSLRPLE